MIFDDGDANHALPPMSVKSLAIAPSDRSTDLRSVHRIQAHDVDPLWSLISNQDG
jgi:hypothetical protein